MAMAACKPFLVLVRMHDERAESFQKESLQSESFLFMGSSEISNWVENMMKFFLRPIHRRDLTKTWTVVFFASLLL